MMLNEYFDMNQGILPRVLVHVAHNHVIRAVLSKFVSRVLNELLDVTNLVEKKRNTFLKSSSSRECKHISPHILERENKRVQVSRIYRHHLKGRKQM